MLGEDDKDGLPGGTRKPYLRSVSWTDRSPSNPNPRPPTNGKSRPCLPPLRPLSISRRSVEKWPGASSDDLGIWPQPPTPGANRGLVKPLDNSNSVSNSNPPIEFQFKKDKLAFFDKECSRIADHIYLGSDAVAKNREILHQNGITHVLNCVGFVCPEYFKDDLVYKTLWLRDSPSEDITSILYDVFDYFEDVKSQDGRVLVHCCQGVSRSTSLVIAYLMWKEGQSFEDAFQFVKAARGVTNPNMGFACQLLQCQKRVHAVPASPNSLLRMYRMAPHSPYDPLHLVPKMLNTPSVSCLDSRGSFIVHIPSAIYVWIGRKCNSTMSHNGRAAAFQVVRYERAKGPVVIVKEGEEPSDFWDAFAKEEGNSMDIQLGGGEKKVNDYDLDFEIFDKAIAGGVVPPFPLGNGSETCLPARASGWGRLRRKFVSGIMKDFVSSKENLGTAKSIHEPKLVKGSDLLVQSTPQFGSPDSFSHLPDSAQDEMMRCGSPDSFSHFPDSVQDEMMSSCAEGEKSPCESPDSFSYFLANSPSSNSKSPSLSEGEKSPCESPDSFSCFLANSPSSNSKSPSLSPCGSPDSFSCFLANSPSSNSKSPSLSPSTSDHSSSFTFSPSSSNWSDLSFPSSQLSPSPCLENIDQFSGKNASSFTENACLLCKEEAFSSSDHALRVVNATCLPCKGNSSPSIAERRGNNPPPRMVVPSVDEVPKLPKKLVRSRSFSLPDIDDDVMKDAEIDGSSELGREVSMVDVNESQTGIGKQKEYGILYRWPNLDKVDVPGTGFLSSRSVYILLASEVSLSSKNCGVVYIWIGCEVPCEKGQNQLTGTDSEDKGSLVHWKKVGADFLDKMGLPRRTPMQIVREGEEPVHLLNHLNKFSFPKA